MTKAFSFPARAWSHHVFLLKETRLLPEVSFDMCLLLTVILFCSNVSAVIGATHLIHVHTCTVFWMCFIILGIIIFNYGLALVFILCLFITLSAQIFYYLMCFY